MRHCARLLPRNSNSHHRRRVQLCSTYLRPRICAGQIVGLSLLLFGRIISNEKISCCSLLALFSWLFADDVWSSSSSVLLLLFYFFCSNFFFFFSFFFLYLFSVPPPPPLSPLPPLPPLHSTQLRSVVWPLQSTGTWVQKSFVFSLCSQTERHPH